MEHLIHETDAVDSQRNGGGENRSGLSRRYVAQARWLLENYMRLLDLKARQESDMRSAPRYTRDDVIYHLSGFGAVDFKERVQTSTISDPTQNAAVSLDSQMERMNEDALREVSEGYEELCRNITVVDIAFLSMESDVRNVAEQLYKQGIPRKKVLSLEGCGYSLKTVRRLDNMAVNCVADTLRKKESFKRNSRGKSSEEWDNGKQCSESAE